MAEIYRPPHRPGGSLHRHARPGAINLLLGVTDAQTDSTPLVVLSAQVGLKPDLQGVAPEHRFGGHVQAGYQVGAALPLASRWYPPHYQGLVLGIAGAGNFGTALSTFFAPWVASSWGWHAAFGMALVPVLATLALVAFLAEDGPTQPAPKTRADYAAVVKSADTGWFCFFYAITFGGFVGLVSFLGIFFHDQYALTRVQAGAFATLSRPHRLDAPPPGRLPVGSVRRHPGADLGLSRRRGDDGGRVGPAYAGPLHPPARDGHDAAGDGERRRLQLVPQRFPGEIGVITGLVGAAGGLGGFVLPNALGSLRQVTQSYGGGFLAFALVGASGAVALFFVGRTWEGTCLGERWGRGAPADAGTRRNA